MLTWHWRLIFRVSSCASVIALVAMSAATIADPVDGWRWVFRTHLLFNGILLIGFALLYHVRSTACTF